MSTVLTPLSNPVGETGAAAAAYVAALLEMLGDRDPLVVLAEHPQAIAELTAGLDDATLRKPEKPGKWSVLEVVQHLADTELVTGYRLRMILAHREPEIQAYDQDLWARELRYNEASLVDALEVIRVMRGANLRLVRAQDARLDRFGIHAERGKESARRLVRMVAGHDLVHQRQIRRIRQAYGV
ncbi:MAG TPA: DinB family protein [Thermoanaerobaculia bacterium]|nr:DinB family protein [Thermoanaerobaculia bacterium]